MIDLQGDIERVFYGPDFAALFLRRRPGVDDLAVPVIIGTQDREALEGRAMAANRHATFPASRDVQLDDLLVAQEAVSGYPSGTIFRVMARPQRVNDGLEMEAQLSALPR
jgi:hypothetical protein